MAKTIRLVWALSKKATLHLNIVLIVPAERVLFSELDLSESLNSSSLQSESK